MTRTRHLLAATHPQQTRVKDYGNQGIKIGERQASDAAPPVDLFFRHTFLGSARGAWERSISRNISVWAARIQWKRDWHTTRVLLELNQLEKEGIAVSDKHVDDLTTRWSTSWWTVKNKHVKDSHKILLHKVETALRAVKEGTLEETVGFGVEVRESSLPQQNRCFGHGKGLFAKSQIPQGEVVGMMPGMVWQGFHKVTRQWATDSEGNPNKLSPYLHYRRYCLDSAVVDADLARYPTLFGENASEHQLKQAQNEYMIGANRYLQGYLPTDKQNPLFRALRQHWMPLFWLFWHRFTSNRNRVPWRSPRCWAARHGFRSLIGLRWDHGFSKLHHVNHCGDTREPNVLYMPVSIPVEFPMELLPYIPNRVDPGRSFGASSPVYTMILGDDRDQSHAYYIISNHRTFGGSYDPDDLKKSQFLYMVPCLVGVTTRPIEPGEELVTDLRLSPHHRSISHWPAWYVAPPGAPPAEAWLYHNLFHPTTRGFRRFFGLVDPGVTFGDALKDPRLFERAWIQYVYNLWDKPKKQ
ncbi:hypothetical protein DIPPA_23537 [Diplonema papillatum]|nr:hypothetical protein DIPPA_23537 [Diplonema papillatum]